MRKTSAYGRKLARQSDFDRQRHRDINPVKEAVLTANIKADIERLRTGVGLHAFMGNDPAVVANLCGRLVYIVCHAAGVHGLGETPEARILAGTANALGDLVEHPESLDQLRATIQSGIAAIDRLMPQLHTLSLAAGSLALDGLINSTQGMGTEDVRKALHKQ